MLASVSKFALITALAILTALPVAAQNPELEAERQAPPTELPSWISEILGVEGLQVTDEEGPLATFWLLQDLPEQEPSSEFGVDFQKFPPGSVIGLVKFHRDWSDYRKRIVGAGVYTMRYGIQPADGDHTGQTYFRDFIMLLPVAGDTFSPAGTVEMEPLVEASKQATGTEHPGIIALYQIYEPVEGPQVVRNDFDEACLALPLADLVMGLVLFGHGQELPV